MQISFKLTKHKYFGLRFLSLDKYYGRLTWELAFEVFLRGHHSPSMYFRFIVPFITVIDLSIEDNRHLEDVADVDSD